MPNKRGSTAKPLVLDRSEQQWFRTLQVIPTGTQTFSKAPFQHVNGVSPKFLERGSGCLVWDLDGNEYIDFMLGLGPAILGHADDAVNDAVLRTMPLGNALSLPHPLETELAELLVKLIPCAEMVRFGKNGSDVTAGSVRVARAFTGRDKIACCGYHGWQDWYIGSTLRNLGVPQGTRDQTHKFEYNNIESLEKIFSKNKGEVAAVIMEPVNFHEPRDNFLGRVKDLAHANGALLIFDEIITGFRMSMGGAQDYYNILPDLACFGKAMGNGFPISAVVGRADIMALFDDVFFSFTFGGELTSIAAGLATIKALQERKAVDHIHSMGQRLMSGFKTIIAKLKMDDHVSMIGFPFWPEYVFSPTASNSPLEVQSLFQQEIVRRGILSRAGMFISTSHRQEDIDKTLGVFAEALAVVKEAVAQDKVLEWLDGEVIQPVIRPPAKE
ncbi:MAG: aminotransferase class III-fold pyridoxal phosphate-dependent enzyme [Desulfobulbaceae bacterium]|nr:aminotransferase class III-fold pyridoxal phosphate-dependent enzyme [Desulfobulbaceae bacterium]